MKQHRFKVMALTAALSTGALCGAASLHAANVDDILNAGKQSIAAGKASQQRVDKIAARTDDIVDEFRTVSKTIEGVRVYNQMQEAQIAHQLRLMEDLKVSIAGVQDTERQIPPLTVRMIDNLEGFVALDMPFDREQRRKALERQRDNINRSDLSVAEKFRQILEVYKFELEYGSKIDAYTDLIELNPGEEKQQVNILRVGRIALIYQTKDQERTGVWDQDTRQWVELDSGAYRTAVANALRIAKRTASQDVLTLPIKAPEAQQ